MVADSHSSSPRPAVGRSSRCVGTAHGTRPTHRERVTPCSLSVCSKRHRVIVRGGRSRCRSQKFPPNPFLAGFERAKMGLRVRCAFTPCTCARVQLRQYPRSPSSSDRPAPDLARLRTHGRTDAKRAHHSGHIQALSVAGIVLPAPTDKPVAYILILPHQLGICTVDDDTHTVDGNSGARASNLPGESGGRDLVRPPDDTR